MQPTPFSLPPLDYDYNALEPAISAEIMQLHHTKHHQAYVNNLNGALERYRLAESKGDLDAMIALEPTIRFNGGGHLNHSLFWKMLTPVSKGGGQLPAGPLADLIQSNFGSLAQLIEKLSALSTTIQGSGWGWLAYHKESKRLLLTSCANQDPITTQGVVGLLGLDVWEHAYYLQYKNVRANYLENIWKVIDWKYVEQRLLDATKS